MQPALALGQTVHDTLERISFLPALERFQTPLSERFLTLWDNVAGEKGGFLSDTEEELYKEKGLTMIQRVESNPGPLMHKAVKIRQELPHYFLSEAENIILCGKIDWLEYIDQNDSVHIIDFKTGKYDEDPTSLQLPIYYLLTVHTQSRNVSKASYWYLERDTAPRVVSLPDLAEAEDRVLEIAKKIALARKLEHLKCKQKDGCTFCLPYEQILLGKARFVGMNIFGQDIYVIERAEEEKKESFTPGYPTDQPF